jgi:hypothetical protein
MATMDFTTKPLMRCDVFSPDEMMGSCPVSASQVILVCRYCRYCVRMRVRLSLVWCVSLAT